MKVLEPQLLALAELVITLNISAPTEGPRSLARDLKLCRRLFTFKSNGIDF